MMSPSLSFLHDITYRFIHSLSQNPDVEHTLTPAPLNEDELQFFLQNVPFAHGMERIQVDWLNRLWQRLSDAFREEIKTFQGTVRALKNALIEYKNQSDWLL